MSKANVHPAADSRVLALRVLAHANHVDVARPLVSEWTSHAGKQLDRAQVDVEVEALADR